MAALPPRPLLEEGASLPGHLPFKTASTLPQL